MSKPKALEYLKFNTQILELYKAITTIITTIPADYWVRLRKNELFIDPEDGFIYIRN
jgi:hypothetical protein